MSSSNSCHELQNPPLPANNLDSLKSNAETNNGDDKMMPQCDMVQPVALESKPLSLVSAHCNNNARQTNTIRASTIIKADASKLLHRTELAPKSTLQASASILEGISLVPLSSKPFLSTSNLANSCTSSSAKKEEKIMPRNDSISNNNKNEHPKKDAISHETAKGLQSQKAKHLQMQHQTQYQSQINSKPLQSQLSQTQSQNHQTSPMPLRRGKWTSEEEAYALTVIREFNAGYLDAHPGTTLRSYLSEKLECDPMRITKKFTGDASIGKKVFHPAIRSELNTKEIEDAQVCNLLPIFSMRFDCFYCFLSFSLD